MSVCANAVYGGGGDHADTVTQTGLFYICINSVYYRIVYQ